MGKEQPIQKIDRRKTLLGLGAGILAPFFGAKTLEAQQRDGKNATPEDAEFRENIARVERETIQRTREYELLLRGSQVLIAGQSNEIIQFLRRGLPDASRSGFTAGPNDSLPGREHAPRLYPQFDPKAPPASPKGYPGLRLSFGRIMTNAVRLGAEMVVRPRSMRPTISAGVVSESGVVAESIQLRGSDADAGVTTLSRDISEASVNNAYAVALHTSQPHDDGPWGKVGDDGRIDLTGYLVSTANRPALTKLVDTSIDTFIAPAARESFRNKVKDSMLLIGNFFEWQYVFGRVMQGDSGVGQPVFARLPDGSFVFCGIVQDLLPLNTTQDATRGAVAYIVAKPENIRKIVGNKP